MGKYFYNLLNENKSCTLGEDDVLRLPIEIIEHGIPLYFHREEAPIIKVCLKNNKAEAENAGKSQNHQIILMTSTSLN